jgi:hypothetical protein
MTLTAASMRQVYCIAHAGTTNWLPTNYTLTTYMIHDTVSLAMSASVQPNFLAWCVTPTEGEALAGE